MPGLYYLISKKCYEKEERIWKLALAVIYLYKMISTFYKDHSDKPITILLSINSTPPILKSITKPTAMLIADIKRKSNSQEFYQVNKKSLDLLSSHNGVLMSLDFNYLVLLLSLDL